MVRDKLLGSIRHNYKPGGLANIRVRDGGVPEIIGGFRRCEMFHISRIRNGRTDALTKENKKQKLHFSHIDQTWPDGDALRKFTPIDLA